ncbi:MAG: peptide-methionine (S)-S-oxide reductase [Comamonadaceae bacterium]|nr:MAG: peptide-methionine (S)-S-oxide reductase [Comamonadaceae bacterium]
MKSSTFAAACLVIALQWEGAALAVQRVPAPAADAVAPSAATETAVFAGGCFWGVQGVLQHVKGVSNAVSGYAGGAATTARYDEIGSGRTGHAESVRISYDPKQISYGKLLQIYFSVAHDPTELNRQGPDTGTQYRSTVFPANADQARVANAYIAQLNQARTFGKPLATTVEPLKPFYPAEAYHQDFLVKHPTHGYIVVNDLPKVADLQRLFPESFRAQPVLVNSQ